jgi:hypothetical protein
MLFFLMVLHQVAGLIKKNFSAESRKAKIFMPLHPAGILCQYISDGKARTLRKIVTPFFKLSNS